MSMEVVVRAEKNATVLDLHGRLDLGARWDFKAVMNQCLLTEEEHLIINLEGLSFIDSAGLGFLVLSYVQFTGMHRQMSWVQHRGHVKTMLEELKISNMVPIFSDERQALASR